MIYRLLRIKACDFDELYNCLKSSHTKQSLLIELNFLIEIGKIILIKEKYKIV